ncbi:MAG: arsenate reductase ArsC [Candidatus Hodarchaeota archaeon]
MVDQKKTILFICMHNSARSQMAEALLRKKYDNFFLVLSAGTKPTSINPYTRLVLAEVGIDISTHKSRHVRDFFDQKIDLVVTVCDSAKEECPFFSGANRYEHKSFEDPSTIKGSEEEILSVFRRIRDEISSWIDIKFGKCVKSQKNITNSF